MTHYQTWPKHESSPSNLCGGKDGMSQPYKKWVNCKKCLKILAVVAPKG